MRPLGSAEGCPFRSRIDPCRLERLRPTDLGLCPNWPALSPRTIRRREMIWRRQTDRSPRSIRSRPRRRSSQGRCAPRSVPRRGGDGDCPTPTPDRHRRPKRARRPMRAQQPARRPRLRPGGSCMGMGVPEPSCLGGALPREPAPHTIATSRPRSAARIAGLYPPVLRRLGQRIDPRCDASNEMRCAVQLLRCRPRSMRIHVRLRLFRQRPRLPRGRARPAAVDLAPPESGRSQAIAASLTPPAVQPAAGAATG